MMPKLSTYALAGALAFALAPVAGRAADLPEPPLLEPVAPAEFGSAWYIRGDVGYKTYRDPKVSFKGTAYDKEDLDDTGVVGGGVGLKVNSWLRTDVTLDYEFKSKFKSRLNCPGACGAPGYSDENAKISAWTGLWNVYADLGDFHGFMPYVGAGVGASRIKVSNYDFTNPNGKSGTQPGDSNWDFSWALMAGVGYRVTDNLVVDLGYRYLNLGDGKSGKATGFGKGKKEIKFDDIQAHEFRVGVRYMLD